MISTNPINRLSASNAHLMSAANARMNLAFRGRSGNFSALLAADKNLALQMLNDSFEYQAYSKLEESEKKATDENIKRSFSIFK